MDLRPLLTEVPNPTGGTLYQPQIVRAVETNSGTIVQEFSPRVRRQVDIRPENLALVQKALTTLSEEKAAVFVYHELLGMKPEEISELVDLSLIHISEPTRPY